MSAFLFALLGVVIAGIGARDQLLVAALAARQGARPAVLLVALVCALASGALAGAAAGMVVPGMAPGQRQMLAALALGLAAGELLLARRSRVPDEPTHSLGAFGVVVFALQLLDGARLLVFAVAAATTDHLAAALGGMLGGAAAMVAGWLGAERLLARNLAPVRRGLGVLLLAIAVWLGLAAM